MRRFGSMILMGSVTLTLAACGLADSRSPVPDFMRARQTEPAPPERAPDIGALVGKEVDVIFVPTSRPHDVQVSQPHRDLRSSGWIACVRAELTSATGAPLGPQIYRVAIDNGVIVDRRRVENEDNCASERYAPVASVK